MSQQVGILDITFKAGEDLNSYQYYGVYLSDDQTVALCTTAHLNAIGILQDKPKSGEAAVVRVQGTTKVKAGGTIAVGARVSITTSGKAITETTASATEVLLIGTALEAAIDGDIFEILLEKMSFVKGAA